MNHFDTPRTAQQRSTLAAACTFWVLTLGTALTGCGNDGMVIVPPGGSPCPGPMCTCGGGGRDCTCADSATCNTICTDSCNLDCGAGGRCDYTCASSCNVDCPRGSTCDVTTENSSNVDCIGATCTAEVGASSNVDCSDGGSCVVTCTSSCNLNCLGAASCTLRCAGDAAAHAVTGTDQCREGGGTDAGPAIDAP